MDDVVMVDFTRLLELLNYSDKAFEISEYFEYLEVYSGILCSEEMCLDTSNHNVRIAFLVAIGDYEELESEFDYFRNAESYRQVQLAV